MIPLLIPLAISWASPDSNTALHIEHCAEASATKDTINKNEIKIRMVLIIRFYHQIYHYPRYSDVQPYGESYDRDFFVISKPFGNGPYVGDQHHRYNPNRKYNMGNQNEIVDVFHRTFPPKRGRIWSHMIGYIHDQEYQRQGYCGLH